jgi:hypothetical protein
MKAALQSGDETAAFHGQYETDLRRCFPTALITAFGVDTMNLSPLDIGEPQRLVSLDPHGPFTKLGSNFPYKMRLATHSSSLASFVRPR